MPRTTRMLIKGEPAVYHVISRTALEGYVIGDIEKEFLLKLITRLSSVYFADVLGFCLMGTHFHLVVKMQPGEEFSDEAVRERFERYYQQDKKRVLMSGQIPSYRAKWSSLSEYVREVKQGFSRFYNKQHKRKGFFWSGRFKSMIVEDGETLLNLLAYVDLNPVRAGIVSRPEDYRWNSLGYHLQTNNKENFLSLDFGIGVNINSGIQEFRNSGNTAALDNEKTNKQILDNYRQYVYEKGGLATNKGKSIPEEILVEEKRTKGAVSALDRFQLRTRYFTDSGVIGSKEFVRKCWMRFQEGDVDILKKRIRKISGFKGIYSLKRLSD